MSDLFIPEDFFDTESMGTERFVGKILQSKIAAGTRDHNAGQAVWFLEVENMSRQMKFNYTKEIKPSKSKTSTWFMLLNGFKELGVNLSPATVSMIEDQIYWFEIKDMKLGNMEAKNVLIPVGIATEQDLADIARQRAAAAQGEPVNQPAVSPEDIEMAVCTCATGVSYADLITSLKQNFPDVVEKVGPNLLNNMLQAGKLTYDPIAKTYTVA